jgi:hypothetical protein
MAPPGGIDETIVKCKKCERGPKYNKAHHPTCKESNAYKKKKNGRKSSANKRGGKTNPFTRVDGEAFFQPRAGTGTTPTAPDITRQSTSIEQALEREPADSFPDNFLLSPEALKEEIQKRAKSPSYLMKKSKSCPLPVTALVEYLLTLTSFRWREGTNSIMASDTRSAAMKRLDWYRKKFPPGTIGFTVPKDDRRLTPDPLYSTLEGCTFYIVCWELNIPDIFLACCESNCDGELIHRGYDYKNHGFLTPIFEVSGGTSWAASMQYECNRCGSKCKGSDARMLHTLPPQYRTTHPADPRFAVQKLLHLSRPLSCTVQKLMVAHGNGEQLSKMIHQARGERFWT